MADETLAANKRGQSVITGGRKDLIADYMDIYDTNGSDITQGVFVTTTGETDPDVDLWGSGEINAGIVLDYAFAADKKASFSLGVTIPDNKKIKTLRPTGGLVKIQILIDRTTTTTAVLKKGTPVYINAAGKVTSTRSTPEAKFFVGRVAEDYAAFTANKVIEVWY